MYKIFHNIEGEKTTTLNSNTEFIYFMRSIAVENGDEMFSITCLDEAKNYLKDYCDNLTLIPKTLVIHPKDRSTEFLSVIYKDIPNVTLLEGEWPATMDISEVNELIKSHDRVIMLGHGCPVGLFSMSKWLNSNGLVISNKTAELLKEKTDNIYIWCNADQYVKGNGLKGFYSGMFISEVGEAWGCGVRNQSLDMIEKSNNTFSEILSKYVNENSKVIHENVTKEYGMLGENSPVARYNNERLYVNE